MASNPSEQSRKVARLKAHPFAKKVLGAPSQQEIKELAADMKDKGQSTPLHILSDGTILDGLTRWMAAQEAGITELRVIVHELDDTAAKKFILEANLLRHHYDKLTFARVFQELKLLMKGPDGKVSKKGEGDLRDRLAKRFNISGRTLDRHVKMLRSPAEAQTLYRKNVLSDSVMVALAGLNADQQKAVLAEIRKANDSREKNLAAKVAIGNLRKKGNPKKDIKASGNGDVDDDASAPAEPGTADTGDVSEDEEIPVEDNGDDTPADAADEDVAEDRDGQGDDDDDGMLVVIDEAAEVDEDDADAQVAAYSKVLEELPDQLDDLVDHMDDIVGQAMDADQAVVELRRIVTSAKTLMEAERARAEALDEESA